MKRIILVILLILVLIPCQVSAQTDKYALIISYDNKGDCRVFASTCARLLKDVLTDNGFSQKNIKFLNGNKATKTNIIEAVNLLNEVESEIVVAFFGHGSATHVMLKGLAISHIEIRDLLSNLQSQKQLIIIDTCGSAGAILAGKDGVTLNATNRIVLTSTVSEKESSIFSWHLTNWCHAVLRWGLLEGNADFNGDGKVSIQEAATLKGGISDGYGQEFFL